MGRVCGSERERGAEDHEVTRIGASRTGIDILDDHCSARYPIGFPQFGAVVAP